MSAAFVQNNETGPIGGSTASVTFGSSVASGNTLMLVIFTFGTSATSVSGCGATWSALEVFSAALNPSSGSDSVELWIGKGATSGTTITASFDSARFSNLMAAEFSGCPDALTSAHVTGNSTSPATPSISATATGQAVFAAVLRGNGGSGSGFTSFSDTPAAFTTLANRQDLATNWIDYSDAYRITTATGAHQRVASATPAQVWCGVGVLLGVNAARGWVVGAMAMN